MKIEIMYIYLDRQARNQGGRGGAREENNVENIYGNHT